MKKIIIIGSGFGGLSLAIRLQSKGYQVKIFEKNEILGGHAYQFIKNGYTFDMGPSLITAPQIIQDVFDCANKKMEDCLEITKLDPFYRIYFHDGSFLNYTDNSETMKSQMAKFNQKDAENYDNFIKKSEHFYKAVIEEKLGATPFDNWGTMLRFIPKAIRINALKSAYKFVTQFFQDPRHQFSFSFHPLFIGGNPFRAPSLYLMIPYLEKADGVWFSKGGMYSLVQSFQKLFVELGGEFETNAEVKEIMIKDGQALGVVAKDNFYKADAVVSNADFYHTYKKLIKSEFRKKWSDNRLENVSYSMSAYLLYLGVKKQYPKLEHHTLILSHRYKELITDIFDKKILPDDFSMYLHVPTRTDPEMAPKDCESMYVLIPVANQQSGVNWNAMVDEFTNKVINFLENDFGLQDLRKNIEVQRIFTPLDFAKQRNSHLGSAWGVEPKLTQTAIFRPHNRSEDVKNLYLVGANTHPGAGVPGVLLTAETTEKLILNDVKI